MKEEVIRRKAYPMGPRGDQKVMQDRKILRQKPYFMRR